jgi:hypothetical protein
VDAEKVIGELIYAANAITGFAVLQNIVFAYGLLKRELNLKIEGNYQWAMAIVGACWNGTYAWLIWWCSSSAIEIATNDEVPLDQELIRTLELLGTGKWIAAAFFGFWPVWIIIIYNCKSFWPSKAEQQVVIKQVTVEELVQSKGKQ